MNTTTDTIGNQIDTGLRTSSQSCTISLAKPETILGLLALLSHDKHLPMLRSTVAHVSNCLNVPLDQLKIEALVGSGERLTTYLQARRYKPNAIRSYRNYIHVLLRRAEEFGWTPPGPSEASAVWEAIISQLPKGKRPHGIIRYAINIGKTPSTLTEDDLRNWMQMMLSQNRAYHYVREVHHSFRRELAKAGLAAHLPNIFRNWKPALKYFTAVQDNGYSIVRVLQRKALGQGGSVNEEEVSISTVGCLSKSCQ